MSYDLSKKLVVAISSRALFDLEVENKIFEEEGVEAYKKYQLEHEDEPLSIGTAFPLAKALLAMNSHFEEPIVEVIIMSRNTPETGLRVFNSIDSHGIAIQRAAFTGGEEMARYLAAFDVDLFLSKNEEDIQAAINNGFAAALIYNSPEDYKPDEKQIRIAFDGDAVIFSKESEMIFKTEGLDAFVEHERLNAERDLMEGPFSRLLKTLSKIKEIDSDLIKIAIVTARSNPAHKRVIYTLRNWGVKVDEAFFLGGVKKKEVLRAFNAHIFFDDQDSHVQSASRVIPSSRVPYIQD